jgi:hypothetical protein
VAPSVIPVASNSAVDTPHSRTRIAVQIFLQAGNAYATYRRTGPVGAGTVRAFPLLETSWLRVFEWREVQGTLLGRNRVR